MATPNSTRRTTDERATTAGTAAGPTAGAPDAGPQGPGARATTPSAGTASRGGAGGGGATDATAERAQQVPTSRETGREPGRETGREAGRPRAVGGGTPMAPGSLHPFALMRQLQSEMDRLFEDFGFGRSPLGLYRRSGSPMPETPAWHGAGALARAMWTPQLDMFRRGDEIVVRADLPGLSKDDVTVDVEDSVLTIRGERRHEAQEDREGYYWSERHHGAFERSVALPEGVDEARASATFRDGVLEVTVPAPKAEQQRRRVEIR